MKYVMLEFNGIPAPILFPDYVPHKAVSVELSHVLGQKIKSAGFVSIGETVETSGHSESLGVSSNPDDAKIIATVLGLKELAR